MVENVPDTRSTSGGGLYFGPDCNHDGGVWDRADAIGYSAMNGTYILTYSSGCECDGRPRGTPGSAAKAIPITLDLEYDEVPFPTFCAADVCEDLMMFGQLQLQFTPEGYPTLSFYTDAPLGTSSWTKTWSQHFTCSGSTLVTPTASAYSIPGGGTATPTWSVV